ncbi:site-specific integrase [Sulfuriferula sp. GW1]|uniref:site-specific integrase n=1 Tax=Sulfuriferula sp. GW1 TaxID=3345111 RepID=UPI0039B00BEB
MSFDVKPRGNAWRVRVRIYDHPAKTATFDTYRDAHDWAVITHGELLAAKKAAKFSIPKSEIASAEIAPSGDKPADVLISSVLDEYLINVLPTKASNAQETGRVGRLNAFFGEKRLQEVTEQELDDYKNVRLLGKLGQGRGCIDGTVYLGKNRGRSKRKAEKIKPPTNNIVKIPSTQTVRHELALLRRALNHWVIKQKFAPTQSSALLLHPIMTVTLPDKAAPRTRRFSDDELFKILSGVCNDQTRAAIAFAACTSLRRSEIVSLNWEDVDIARRVIRLRKLGYVKKSKVKERDVPLIPAAIEILKKLGAKNSGPIWPIAPATLTQAFGRAKERAGLKDARLHDLRREAISRYVEIYGLGVEKIMNFSGHRQVQTLVDYYMKPQSQVIAAQIAQLKLEVNFIPL